MTPESERAGERLRDRFSARIGGMRGQFAPPQKKTKPTTPGRRLAHPGHSQDVFPHVVGNGHVRFESSSGDPLVHDTSERIQPPGVVGDGGLPTILPTSHRCCGCCGGSCSVGCCDRRGDGRVVTADRALREDGGDGPRGGRLGEVWR